MDIAEIKDKALAYSLVLDAKKAALAPTDFGWYPYGTLNNFYLLDQLLKGGNRNLLSLIGGDTAVDIGAADGDTAFFMESLGVRMHVVDYPPTNFNGCRGVKALKESLGSQVEIHQTDLDSQFTLPRERYGFAFFLGILYHLKNPFFALERLATHCKHAVISTRITRYNVAADRQVSEGGVNDSRVDLSRIPAAYLVAEDECNNDATNFWMFTDAGLQRVLHRAGWDVLDHMTVGNTLASDPATPEGDERAFCLVRSRRS